MTAIIDGDFSEWASVPVQADPADNIGSIDIATIQIANDDDFLYISYTHHTALSNPTFLAIDTDSNVATGFDVFSLGLVGVEAQWQNDFPFTSSAGVFNNGSGMSGDFFGSGAAFLNGTADATQHELAISLDITFNGSGAKVFDDDNFTIFLYTDQGAGDTIVPVSYTLASVPEPSSIGLLSLGGLALILRRKK
tara:strand:- start:70 stop:651 length:582 start_codon:yes stop_codon:yes gene_type:complete